MNQNKKAISKTLSYWLRHAPQAGGLTLDRFGWAPVDAVLSALRGVSLETLVVVVEENDKQRFEFSPDMSRLRARQGHSVDIDLELSPVAPPARLFHGTVGRVLDQILREGLRPMARHHVHLSPDVETATRVGARRGRPVVLAVDAAGMAADGHDFFVTANGVWLTDRVPPPYLGRMESSAP
jgi:putative RNA 2'-phosphotransferase